MQERPERFCLYCFTSDNLSRAHLFPRSIGGKIQEKICCERCNSLIGRKIEAPLEECLFFVGGISELNLKSKDQAFKKIPIRDTENNDTLKYVDGVLHKAAAVTETGNLTGSIKDIIRRGKKKFQGRPPEHLEQYMKQVRKGPGTFHVGEEEYEIKLDIKNTSVEYRAKVLFPWDLLAKISYEAMWLFQQYTGDILQDFRKSTFEVFAIDRQISNITVAPTFQKRVFCRSHSILSGETQFHELKYRPYHRINFRVSQNGTAYILIVFFGVLPFLVALGQVDVNDCNNIDAYEKSFFFPVHESIIYPIPYPSKYDWVKQEEHALADIAWNTFSQPL